MSCDIENFRKWIKANDLTPIMSVVEDDLELLTNLDLSKRNIKDLPESIGVLKNLTVLKLSNNKLRKLPKAIGPVIACTGAGLVVDRGNVGQQFAVDQGFAAHGGLQFQTGSE